MSDAVRWGARRVRRVAPAAVCLLVGLVAAGCSGQAATAPGQFTREQWATATVDMLRSGLHVAADGAVLVLPAAQANDPYTAALAVVGAGDRASAVLESAGADVVRQRFREAVKPAQLAVSVAGPIGGATAILRADHVVPLLDDASRSSLRAVLDAGLAAPVKDVYVAGDAVELATLLGYRSADARGWLGAVLRDAPPGCSGTEALYAVGAAYGRGVSGGCPAEVLRALVDTERARLGDALGASAHPGLGEAEVLLALARVAGASGDAEAAARLRPLLDAFDRATVERRIGDVTPVAADLAMSAALMGVTRSVPPALVEHVTVVLRGNGEALATRLDADGVALTIRARRALGDLSPEPALSAGPSAASPAAGAGPSASLGGASAAGPSASPGLGHDPQGELELSLAGLAVTGATDPATASRLHGLAEKIDLSTPTGSLVALRAATVLGRAGCDLRQVTDLATALLGRPRPATGAEDHRRALAWRLLGDCGMAPADAARQAILAPALGVLAAVKPGASRPALIEATRAAAVACALQPAALADLDVWKAFADDALHAGGVADPQGGYVDLESTYDLAVLSSTDRTSCTRTGQLG